MGGLIGVGQTATVLYEVRLDSSADDLSLGRVGVMATPPGGRTERQMVELPTRPVRFERASKDLRIAVAAASLAELLAAQQPLDRVPPERVLDLARRAARPEYERDQQLVDLARRSVQLLRTRQECHRMRATWVNW